MTQWYVKDLSKLTQVSVQTLHHYDHIGLLEPSVRLPNGYRLYSEKDLLKLQQIIALKFFGFELSQIKILLATDVDVLDHFATQSQFLEEKAKTLLEASQTLKSIISNCSRDKSVPWETVIQLIEVYRMTQELEKTWAGKALNAEELKEYAHFRQDLKKRFTPEEEKDCKKEWADLSEEVNANTHRDPESDFGIAIGKRSMDWVNKIYGKEHAALRTTVWEKGFKGGHVNTEHSLSPEGVIWLDKAMRAYHMRRIFNILDQVGIQPDKVVLKLWQDLLTDIYGDQQAPRKELCEAIMKDNKHSISQAAKDWLKQVSNL